MDVASHTRNIVLYGPPGTGKTFTAREFAQAWLGSPQTTTVSSRPAKAQRWWEVIALALSDLEEATVPQLLQHPEVQALAGQRPDNNSVSSTVWRQLQSHSRPEDGGTVDRHRPSVFTRSGNDPASSAWTLTEGGRAEVARLRDEQPEVAELPGDTALSPGLHLITFHPAFTYEEFVEGLRPTRSGGFEIRDGAFKRICRAAHENPDQDHVVIIDEINRADTAKTFGELITLLEDDKRAEPGTLGRYAVTLPYSDAPDNRFSVPSNVYIVGTMNTADRSITLMDVALRRRFTFIEVPPRPELLKGLVEGTGLSPERLLTTLNEGLTAALDPDHRVGHAYLMGPTLSVRDLSFRWRHKLVPLLQEYFYARDEQLRSLLGEALHDDATGKVRLGDDDLIAALVKFTGTGGASISSA
nr:AAA family ATPase [Deinococcus aestuarii]